MDFGSMGRLECARARAALVLGIVLMVGAVLAQEPHQGGTLVVATQADAATMDPHNTGDVPSSNLQTHIFDTLVRWGDDGSIVPSLAESWTWSEDGLTLTMQLVGGVTFHDGTPLTSEVVKYNFDRILTPENNVRARPQFSSIVNVEVPDAATVVFTLEASDGSLMSGFAAPIGSIISQRALETYGAEVSLRPVGTGPFKFVSWDTNDQIVLEAFEDHFRGRPYLDGIVFRPVPDQQARVAMLEAGDVDVAAPIPLQDVTRIQNDDRFVVASIVGMDNLHMPLNFLNEPLGDVRVRRALNYAVDNAAIARSLYLGFARPLTDSPLAPAVFGYSPVGTYYEYDLEKARELLAEAGYPDGFDMLFWIPDGRYIQDRRVGEAVAGFLGELGINVTIQTFEWATYVNMILSGRADDPPEYDAVMISFAVGTRDADRGLGPIFRCDQWVPAGFGLSFYCNPAVDEWHTRGRRQTDPADRLAAYAEMSKLIMEDAPAIFVVAYEFVAAHSTRVQGLRMDPNGAVWMMNAWLD